MQDRDEIKTLVAALLVIAKKEASNCTKTEFYQKYGTGINYSTFSANMSKNGIKFAKATHSFDHVRKVNIEHMKENAHLYTSTEYRQKFAPDCSRQRIHQLQQKYGIKFAKRRKIDKFDNLLDLARKDCKDMFFEDFCELHKDELPVSKNQFYLWCKEKGIRFKHKPYYGEYSSEEIEIIRKYYPTMGAKCVKYLPGRKEPSIRNYASRHGIKGPSPETWLTKKVRDHLGNKYESTEEMVKAYGIDLVTYQARISAGLSKEEALTAK